MAGNSPDRTESLLALILLALNEGKSIKQKAFLLSGAGFSNVEIANILNTSSAGIAQALYEYRRGAGAKKPRKGKKR